MLNFHRAVRDKTNGTVRKGNCRACQVRVLSCEYGKHCNSWEPSNTESLKFFNIYSL